MCFSPWRLASFSASVSPGPPVTLLSPDRGVPNVFRTKLTSHSGSIWKKDLKGSFWTRHFIDKWTWGADNDVLVHITEGLNTPIISEVTWWMWLERLVKFERNPVYIAAIIAAPRLPMRGNFWRPHKVMQTTRHERATVTSMLAILQAKFQMK